MNVGISEFQQMCNERNSSPQFATRTAHWILPDWSNAIAGEAGELCNVVKKVRRGDFGSESTPVEFNDAMRAAQDHMAEEAADVITYAMLFLAKLGRDAEVELLKKFHKVSERHVAPVSIEEAAQADPAFYLNHPEPTE